jgi:DNA polymerase I-like protein with 3'-5' exonuclease and polymerase domains/intein/homing endonuclease
VIAPAKADRRIVRTMAEAADFLEGAAQSGMLYLDTETTGLRAHDGDRIVGFSAHWRKGERRQSIYVPLRHEWKPEAINGDLFGSSHENDPFENADMAEALEIIRAVLALPVPNIWWHARFDSAMLSKDGVMVDWSRTRCAMLLCQIIYAGKYESFELKPFAKAAFGLAAEDRAALDAWFKEHKTSIRVRGAMAKANPYLVAEYAMADCEMVADVRERSMKDYDPALQATAHLEYAAMPELNLMEEGGCAVRHDFLREQEAKLKAEADSIASEFSCDLAKARDLAKYLVEQKVPLTEMTGGGKAWEALFGVVAKWLSSPGIPKGVAAAFERESYASREFSGARDVLEDICARRGVSIPKEIAGAFSKGGPSRQVATHEKALSRTGHPLALRVLRWKELTKSLEFLGSLRLFAESGDGGRIHPSIRQLGADTGRTSQSEPNLQQMPRSADAGVRRAFVAPPGFNLWLVDYEQLQLRIAAIIARDKRMIEAFLAGRDIHRETQTALGLAERIMAKCVTGDALVCTDAGLLRMDELVPRERPGEFQDAPFKLSAASKEGVRDVTQVYYGGEQPVYRVTTKLGFVLTATAAHRFLVFRDGRMDFVPLADLHPKDELPLKIGTSLFGREVGLPKVLLPARTSSKPVSLPAALSPEAARWLGYYVSEGSRSHHGTGYAVTIGMLEGEAVDDAERCWRVLVGSRLRRYLGKTAKGNRVATLSCTSRDFFHWMGMLDCGDGSANKRVPRLIRAAPKEFQTEFLRGLFEGDGSVACRNVAVSLTSKSEILVRQVQAMLANLGIVSCVQMTRRPKYGAFWIVGVFGREARRFSEVVGFASAEKRSKLSKALVRDKDARSTRFVPVSRGGLDALLRTPAVQGHIRERVALCAKKGVRFGESLWECIPRGAWPVEVEWAVENGVCSDAIESIVPCGTAPVYDLVAPPERLMVTNGLLTEDSVNFAIVFGSGAETLADTINKHRTENRVTVEQAQVFLDGLRAAYPDVRQAYFSFQSDAKKNGGWVRLPSGRRRWLDPEFHHVALNTCILEGMRIATDRGYEKIEAAQGRVFDGERFCPAKIFPVGQKALVRVVCAGAQFTCSTDHRVAILSPAGGFGWKEAHSLLPGDALILSPHLSPGSKCAISADEAEVTGILLGDGSYCRGVSNEVRVAVNRKERSYSLHIERLLKRVFPGAGIGRSPSSTPGGAGEHIRFCNKAARERMRELGLDRESRRNKTIPEWAFTAPAEVRAALLRGLYDTDGTFVRGRNHGGFLGFTSVGEGLARGVHLLLLSLGIPAKVFFYKNPPYDGFFRIHIPKAGYAFFRDRVGFAHEKKRKLLSRFIDGSKGTVLTPDGAVTTVLRVESAGKGNCYDVTILGGGQPHFVVEGVLVHNCIQMWEADITKSAMARLGPAVRVLGGYMQNFVHDEFQIVLPDTVDEAGVWRLAHGAEVYDHIVPITVSVAKAEPTWGEKRELKKDHSYGMSWRDLEEQGLTMVMRRRSDGRHIYFVPSRDKAANAPSGALVMTVDEGAAMVAEWEIARREDAAAPVIVEPSTKEEAIQPVAA